MLSNVPLNHHDITPTINYNLQCTATLRAVSLCSLSERESTLQAAMQKLSKKKLDKKKCAIMTVYPALLVEKLNNYKI